MRKLYNEFFYIPKHGKIREKVMLVRVATIIAIIIMCLAAMSITAYAYFSYNVTSGSNIIKAANFEANVSITIKDSNGDPVTVTKNGKVQTATLDAGSYTVLLTKGTSTAKTGFCIITIDDTDYYTQQIGVDVGRNLTDGSASVEFTLKVSSTTKIKILSHWGTSSYYGYEETSGNPIYIKSKDFEIDLTTSTVGNDEAPSTEKPGTAESTTTTEPSAAPTTTTTPSTETTKPSETTFPETTGTSEPTSTTEPSNTTEPSTPSNTTESAATESTDTTVSTEIQPTEETTDAPTTEGVKE